MGLGGPSMMGENLPRRRGADTRVCSVETRLDAFRECTKSGAPRGFSTLACRRPARTVNSYAGHHTRARRVAMLLAIAVVLRAADLHDAVRSGNLEQVQDLIAHGAGVNDRDSLGATPLHDAAWSGNVEIAAWLIEHGADVKAVHAEGGSTPLAYAVMKNDVAMVELLLARGADVKAADKSGATALHLAANRGYQLLLELLIAHGAQVNARDRA